MIPELPAVSELSLGFCRYARNRIFLDVTNVNILEDVRSAKSIQLHVNVVNLCNLFCEHGHVEPGVHRRLIMDNHIGPALLICQVIEPDYRNCFKSQSLCSLITAVAFDDLIVPHSDRVFEPDLFY